MLIYRKGDGIKYFLRLTGSALPKAMLPGLLSAFETFCLGLLPGDYLDKLLVHPYPFQPFAYIAAFALVFRTNVAMQRFNEANTWTTQVSSRWGDAVVEALAFDELPRGKPESKATSLAQRRRFQALMLRRFSLMHALGLQYIRRDRVLSHLTRAGGVSAPHPWVPGQFGTPLHQGERIVATRDMREWRELEVLGGVTASELAMLENSPDRVNTIFTTIVHLCVQRRGDGGLGVDAPVLSRLYQVACDGMLGFRQARKLEDIPFPFPYVQAIEVFLIVFMVCFPLVLIHFANGAFETFWVGPVFCFITVTAYMAMHNVARALEDPFVHPPNDLPATSLQIAFNNRLLSTFDALRRNTDALHTQASSQPPTTPPTPSARAEEPDEDALWGEYAELEPRDVRAETVRLLNEWRRAGPPPQLAPHASDGRGAASEDAPEYARDEFGPPSSGRKRRMSRQRSSGEGFDGLSPSGGGGGGGGIA